MYSLTFTYASTARNPSQSKKYKHIQSNNLLANNYLLHHFHARIQKVHTIYHMIRLCLVWRVILQTVL